MVMEQYLINDTTLSAIGDAIRQVKGEEKYLSTLAYSHTSNIDDEGNILEAKCPSGLDYAEVVTLPGATSLKVTITYCTQSNKSYGGVCIWEGNHPEYNFRDNGATSLSGQLLTHTKMTKEYTVEGDTVTFGFFSYISFDYGYYAVVEAEGITGGINPATNYLPSEIPQEIIKIGDKPSIPEEAFTITGSCSYKFAYNSWNWYIEEFGDKVTTRNITSADYMFNGSNTLKEIPFELNCANSTSAAVSMNSMFSNCSQLEILPKLNSVRPSQFGSLFTNCHALREVPADWADNIDWSYITGLTSSYQGGMSGTFQYCYSLRSFPMELFRHTNPYVYYSYSIYNNGFSGCRVLDEIVGLPVIGNKTTWTSNAFGYSFDTCSRLKRMTFESGGTPSWKSQTIDFSKYVGYTQQKTYMTSFGFTTDTQVTDDATYQALKDNPDYWTLDIAYSRYNHDSAVETINSLPDTSAYLASSGGTNTIKFKGDSGSKTDGGAIKTLTAEEIAVATAKGWTVTLV